MSFVPDCAMVFAAGLGTRMRPITDTLPKPLVAVGGRTMLDHMLDRLAELGVGTAIVNVHHLPDLIEARLAGRTEPRIVVSDERKKLLDQGGGIKKVLPLLGQKPFMICNTDALWTERAPALARLCADWDPARSDVALLLARREGSVGVDWAGDFDRADDGRLIRRAEGGPMPFVYAGVGLIKPELFSGIDDDVFRLAPFFFRAAEQGRLHGTVIDGTWLHVGTPAAIADAEAALETVDA
jgi:MurNAc alpha-1-phosphate uridylyltransferase